MALKMLSAVIYGDLIMLLKNQVEPYEVNKGDADKLTQKWIDDLSAEMQKGKGYSFFEIKKTLPKITESFSKIPLAFLFILLYTEPIKDDLPLIRRVHRFGGAPGGKPTVSSCQVPSSRWFSPTAVTVTYCCTFTASPWLPTRVRIEGSPAFPEIERK
jgi:hypothetical protein